MAESNWSDPHNVLLKDPLSKETRDERRNLLAVSAIGIIVATTGLIPSKITSLGIEFNPANQRALLWVTAAIVGYFWLAFLIYGVSDFVAWRITFRSTRDKYLDERAAQIANDVKAKRTPILKETAPQLLLFLLKVPRPVSWIRMFFEFIIPLLTGIVAIVVLLRQSFQQ